jgi:hypothetical protein
MLQGSHGTDDYFYNAYNLSVLFVPNVPGKVVLPPRQVPLSAVRALESDDADEFGDPLF